MRDEKIFYEVTVQSGQRVFYSASVSKRVGGNAMKEKKKREFPDVYALLFCMCIVAMIATWIVPSGTFERVADGNINKVVAGSFQYVESNPQTPWDMMQLAL